MYHRTNDWYVYCDICGQRHYASTTQKLSNDTGRGGLVVCRHDVDAPDYSLIPYSNKREQQVKWIRVNHTDATDGSPIFDYENDTVENISSYQYLADSQSGSILILSQDSDIYIATTQEV